MSATTVILSEPRAPSQPALTATSKIWIWVHLFRRFFLGRFVLKMSTRSYVKRMSTCLDTVFHFNLLYLKHFDGNVQHLDLGAFI